MFALGGGHLDKLLSVVIVVFVVTLSIGYSAFNTSLNITGVVSKVRVQKDVRVTGLLYGSSTGSGLSTYEEYSTNSLLMGINLPNQDSTVTYKVTVTNLGNTEMGIFSIDNLPSNLAYSISGYNLKDKICDDSGKCSLGIIKDFYITIGYATDGYNSVASEYNLKLNLDFREICKIIYDGNGGSEVPVPQEVISGGTINISNTSPTRTGYTFQGWGKSNTATTFEFSAGSSITVDSNTTLYAVWKGNPYTVNFYNNLNYLSEKDSLIATIYINESDYERNYYKKYDGAALAGYMYNGWGTGPLLVGTTADSVAHYDTYDIDNVHPYFGTFTYNDKTYYYSSLNHLMEGDHNDTSGLNRPKFSVSDGNKETAARQLLDSNTSTVNQSFIYGTAQKLKTNTYSKTGYKFAGWATEPTGGVVYTDNQSVSNLVPSGSINLYAVWVDNTLISKIKTGAKSDEGVDFSQAPVAGVYAVNSTMIDTNPIYYYRGAVKNNNVLFANKCWKIVRTTETGGVKLIYNGDPTNGQCLGTNPTVGTSAFNTNYNTANDVRYIYADGTPSTIKGVIDAWYETNMTAYTSKLEDTPWCMDLSIAEIDSFGYINYETRNRNYHKPVSPSVSCPAEYQLKVSATDLGLKLNYPVALLTADEATLAGSGNSGYSSDAYLKVGSHWWSLSPSYFGGSTAGVLRVASSGVLIGDDVYFKYGARPAISLAPRTELTGNGDGTAEHPYIVQ